MFPKIILITGSNGFIGGALVRFLINATNANVIGISKGECRTRSNPRFQYEDIDISHKEAVKFIVNQTQPNVIIHCAAISQVDECEKYPKKCSKINIEGTKNLVEAAQGIDAKFILLSSDFVFDGKEKWNSNKIKPIPISVYGKSKLKAEKIVETGSKNYAIIRPVLVYGFSPSSRRNNIFYWAYQSMKNNVPIRVVNDQFRTPTFVDDVIQLIVSIINKNASGVYNIGGSTRLSVYDFVVQIAKISKIPMGLVNESSSKNVVNANLRPLNSCFDNFKIIKDFEFTPLSTDEGIERALEQVNQSQNTE